jgi:hypothetical protein
MDRSLTETLVRDRMRARLQEADRERLAKSVSTKKKPDPERPRRRLALPSVGRLAPDFLRRWGRDAGTS